MTKTNQLTKADLRKKGMAERVARQAGCEVRSGRGSHAVVYSPDGRDQVTIVRGRDVGTGLAGKIFRKFCAWGIIGLIVYAALLINGGI